MHQKPATSKIGEHTLRTLRGGGGVDREDAKVEGQDFSESCHIAAQETWRLATCRGLVNGQ